MALNPQFISKEQATDEDMKFLPGNSQRAPFSSDKEIAIYKAILGAIPSIAFVVQPPGASLAGVLSQADGLLSLAYHSMGQLAVITKALKESKLLNEASGGMKGLGDFCDWLDSHQDSLRRLETTHEPSQENVVEVPEDSDDWLREQVQTPLIAQTIPNGTTLFTRMGLAIGQLDWERPDIRLLALAIDTYLMICYQILVVVYARRARLARGAPKWPQMQGDAYAETRVYRRVLDQKIKWWTEKLEALKKWRIGRVSKLEIVEPTQPMIPNGPMLPTSFRWSDSYTLRADIVMGSPDGIEDRRKGYLAQLDTHINNILSGELGMINCWKLRLEEIEKLLRSPKPAQAPAIQGWVAIPNVNAALKGAVKVMYRYDLSDDGGATRSERSDWTGELNLAEHDGKYPELLLSAETIAVDLTMTVYQRIARTLEGSFEDETEAAVTTKIGDRLWRDGDTA